MDVHLWGATVLNPLGVILLSVVVVEQALKPILSALPAPRFLSHALRRIARPRLQQVQEPLPARPRPLAERQRPFARI